MKKEIIDIQRYKGDKLMKELLELNRRAIEELERLEEKDQNFISKTV